MTSGYWGSWQSGDRPWITRALAHGHRVIVLVAFAGVAACSLGSPKTPDLAGPSELALSLAMTASPDLMARDGAAQSVVTITARDAASQPIRNLALRVDVRIGGALGDLGTLSTRNLSTGSDGRASVIYTAPPPAPQGAADDAMIQIVATPVGTNAANTSSSGVLIHLTAPGVILPPNGTPVPSFFFSPTSPRERESVLFDGSASKDADGRITKYDWNFGDGTSTSGTTPTVTHLYGVAATYRATLTVTDDRGLSATTAPSTITVATASNPVASFVVSPTSNRVGDTVNFNATASSVPPGREIQSWQWDFGDGTSATTSSPTTTHVYAAAKSYAVVLTVTDDIGRRSSVTVTVLINP